MVYLQQSQQQQQLNMQNQYLSLQQGCLHEQQLLQGQQQQQLMYEQQQRVHTPQQGLQQLWVHNQQHQVPAQQGLMAATGFNAASSAPGTSRLGRTAAVEGLQRPWIVEAGGIAAGASGTAIPDAGDGQVDQEVGCSGA
jgi:hypothetical protein